MSVWEISSMEGKVLSICVCLGGESNSLGNVLNRICSINKKRN